MRASAEPGPPRPSSSSSALPCASSLASRAYISSARFLMSRPMALVSRLMLLSRRMEVRKRAFCLPRFFTFKRSRPISVRMARTSLKKLSMAASSPWNSTMCCSRNLNDHDESHHDGNTSRLKVRKKQKAPQQQGQQQQHSFLQGLSR
ncbi:hypothetical protein CRUP_026769 [Coryphaenoides rupestris]|nr:hypothetical protein CRUP_026769 [Coryphaenoides rupestris]